MKVHGTVVGSGRQQRCWCFANNLFRNCDTISPQIILFVQKFFFIVFIVFYFSFYMYILIESIGEFLGEQGGDSGDSSSQRWHEVYF